MNYIKRLQEITTLLDLIEFRFEVIKHLDAIPSCIENFDAKQEGNFFIKRIDAQIEHLEQQGVNRIMTKELRILYKEYIPLKMENGRQVDGTMTYAPEYTNKGILLHWGVTCVEDDNGNRHYSVAIVQKENGEIIEVAPDKIKVDLEQEQQQQQDEFERRWRYFPKQY
jgi:hypothetical protein